MLDESFSCLVRINKVGRKVVGGSDQDEVSLYDINVEIA